MIIRTFAMASGKRIRMPQAMTPTSLTADWDSDRLRCWPKPASAAQAELMLAKALCALFAVGVAAISGALGVLA
ncbi:MAG TPA: hypothetical protein VD932_03885 [Aquabacterium sp.]|nr:hypothetical protein [Aquabacterium sp.]